MASIVNSFAISGVEAYLVDVEVKIITGQPMISIVGLGDTAVKEARERVEAARKIQQQRFIKMNGINCNSQMGNQLIKEYCILEEEGKRLLNHFKTPYRIYAAAEEELRAIPGIGSFLARSIRQARSLDGAFSVLDTLEKKRIKLLIYDDPLYPEQAKVWTEAPIVLYYMGTIRNNSIGIGIVGARRCSFYAKQVAADHCQPRTSPQSIL